MIAKHIVDMHRLKEESLTPDFNLEQIQMYIKVASEMKPQFSKEAAELLKQEYMSLRAAQKSEAQKSFRYTVRQLESLVRLSEAMARAHFDDIIRDVYVREVCRLMKISNINLDKDAVELEVE
mmetsp:Transcript_27266/g.19679  ORF Transcript_27266/g.19679 Transcript_27266/m.19679 type:complete len:123 (+) Transcript_27266:1783-2151(+)|eukprot:CAMPEP_0116883194 /NCGR_PEP_ID=MMETSP0463-20121206/15659_1 /TAXON_ID=181622 /ORGANISM="Strombidinopsis sp, Strain SopsisLIS2011" /LENGTH=122 /DNA_ID=CAMNT_0004537601 /DNA_START=1698 /DNA_END=2066 /DNA_ORIENTATION=-